jgi:hypothetical protein
VPIEGIGAPAGALDELLGPLVLDSLTCSRRNTPEAPGRVVKPYCFRISWFSWRFRGLLGMWDRDKRYDRLETLLVHQLELTPLLSLLPLSLVGTIPQGNLHFQ